MAVVEADAELVVAFRAGLGSLSEAQAEQNRLLRRIARGQRIPIDAPIQGSGTADASGDVVFDCGGPAQGRVWVLRRLAVGGTDPTAVATGSAYFYASTSQLIAQLSASQWFDFASTLPLVGWYTSRQVVIPAPLHIMCRIKGGASGALYVVSGGAQDEQQFLRAEAEYTL
jgi:hypothetical protein